MPNYKWPLRPWRLRLPPGLGLPCVNHTEGSCMLKVGSGKPTLVGYGLTSK
jgi:hypothetical protein